MKVLGIVVQVKNISAHTHTSTHTRHVSTDTYTHTHIHPPTPGLTHMHTQINILITKLSKLKSLSTTHSSTVRLIHPLVYQTSPNSTLNYNISPTNTLEGHDMDIVKIKSVNHSSELHSTNAKTKIIPEERN